MKIEIDIPIRKAYHYKGRIIRVLQEGKRLGNWWQVAPVDTATGKLAGFVNGGDFGYGELSIRMLAELPRAPEYDAPAPPLEGVAALEGEIERLRAALRDWLQVFDGGHQLRGNPVVDAAVAGARKALEVGR